MYFYFSPNPEQILPFFGRSTAFSLAHTGGRRERRRCRRRLRRLVSLWLALFFVASLLFAHNYRPGIFVKSSQSRQSQRACATPDDSTLRCIFDQLISSFATNSQQD
jgi:hypothetical protein